MEEKEIRKEVLERELAPRSFLHYLRQTFNGFQNIAYQGDKENKIHNKIIEKLEAVERGEIKRLMIFCPPRLGKQLAHSTQVLTDKGFVSHGDLHKGMFVYNHKGNKVAVLGETDETPVEYRVTFSDGTKIDCHGNHEWFLSRDRSKFKCFETKELYSCSLKRGEGNGKYRFLYALPNIEPLMMEAKELLIHPYILGFWLGDGKAGSGTICKPKDDLQSVLSKMYSLGYENGNIWSAKTYDCDYTTIFGLVTDLRILGIEQNKKIPEQYLSGSIQQRLELLAGLIDSDGTVNIDKRYGSIRCSISNSNLSIINGIDRICKSMGWKTSINTIPAGSEGGMGIISKKDVHIIAFTPFLDIPTAIRRKEVFASTSTHRKRKITNIEKINTGEMGKCIEVEEGIYLAGTTLIPTHNSAISSTFFPTRLIGRDPTRKIITSSYAANLASDFGRKAREIIKSTKYQDIFPDVKLSDSKREGGNWETRQGGGVYTAGVGGSITGKGADIFIIDDPVKDRQEADSPTIQERNIDWYDSVATTRLQTQDSAIIVIMTRWNTNDLAGYLLQEQENGGDKRDVLTIKGINEEGEEIIRPGKWDKGYMTGVLEKMIKKNREALYQQDPIASMDGIFAREYFDYYLLSDFEKADGILKKGDLRVGIFIDPAFSSSAQSDDAVIHFLGEHKISKQVYQLDTYADTSSPSRTMQALLSMYNRSKLGGFIPEFISVEEAKINRDQTKFIDDLRTFCLQNQIDIPILTYKPVGKKEDRIKFALEPIMSQKGVKFRRDFADKTILMRLEGQLINFPNDKHDDIIDCLAQGIEVFKNRQKSDRYEDWDGSTNRH